MVFIPKIVLKIVNFKNDNFGGRLKVAEDVKEVHHRNYISPVLAAGCKYYLEAQRIKVISYADDLLMLVKGELEFLSPRNALAKLYN